MITDKLLKAINTSKFKIELVETEDNKFIVQYESNRFGERKQSEPVNDYNTASFIFDLKVEELEGN